MIRSSDMLFMEIVKYLIKDLRKNRYLVKDMLSDVLTDPLLNKIYGAKEVNKYNAFLDKEIQINLEYALDQAKLPAIGVRVGGGSELTGSTGDVLGDGYHAQDVNINQLDGKFISPQILIGPVTPIAYDEVTGLITFDTNVNLGPIYEGMIVYDQVNEKSYSIVAVLDNQSLFIEAGSEPDLTNMTIRSSTPNAVSIHRKFFTTETITFICAASEPVETIYLYQLLMYQLARNRIKMLESKNFRVATLNFTPIYLLTNEPPLIYGRDITMTGQVEHNYITDTDLPVEGINPELKIEGMKSPDSILTEVSNQLWDGEFDPK